MFIVVNILAFIIAFICMEGFAWFMHKYVMHGFGWFLHKSHHRPRAGRFEWNDLYAVIFAIPAVYFMWLGTPEYNYVFWAGAGITLYGMCYFLFHDILVHRRIHHNVRPGSRYMQRIVRAHKIHHKNMQKENGRAFGFLYADPKVEEK